MDWPSSDNVMLIPDASISVFDRKSSTALRWAIVGLMSAISCHRETRGTTKQIKRKIMHR